MTLRRKMQGSRVRQVAVIGVLRKPLAAYSCKIMGGKIMALFIILPFMILQETRTGSVEPKVRSVPINARSAGPRL
jgi:hypothetical protein